MFILQLNPMTTNCEVLRAVARAETKESLEAYLARERVESYTDDDGLNMCGGKLCKSFRKGGPLEFFNPPDGPECFVDVGTAESWAEQARLNYQRQVLGLMAV